MNKIHLHNILQQYIEKYDVLDDPEGHNEGYKWDVVNSFKENWDINAKDFPEMFRVAFQEVQKTNLIDNKTVQPIGGITLLLRHDDEVEFVRECFRELFSEDGGDIDQRQNRIDLFIEKINSHIDNHVKGSWKYPQQRNNVIYYLNLWKPEDNYIYKSTEAAEWANCAEFGDDFGSGNTFSLKKYYSMCNELLEELKNNAEIMKLYNIRKEEKAKNFDDDGHILVYDVIYCAKAYNLYRNVPSLKKLSVKERLNIARTAEKRETLLEELSGLSDEHERLSKASVLPDITGEKVSHNMWGEGVVMSCGQGFAEIQFESGKKKLVYPDCVNKFIRLVAEELAGRFEEYLQNKSELKMIEIETEKVKAQLESLK